MNEESGTVPAPRPGAPDRWTLIRDALVIQFKLVVDGLRDVVLVPASLVAALISLARSEDGRPGPEFYDLLAFGKRTERWIDLFGAHRRVAGEAPAEEQEAGIDELVARVEAYVVDEYRRGGVTAQAKEQIDRALDALQTKPKR
jgi:hypothetical protein